MRKKETAKLLAQIEHYLKSHYETAKNYHEINNMPEFPVRWSGVRAWFNRQLLKMEKYLEKSGIEIYVRGEKSYPAITFGSQKLHSLSPDLIIQFMNAVAENGHSGTTIKSVTYVNTSEQNRITTIIYYYNGVLYKFKCRHAITMAVSNHEITKVL